MSTHKIEDKRVNSADRASADRTHAPASRGASERRVEAKQAARADTDERFEPSEDDDEPAVRAPRREKLDVITFNVAGGSKEKRDNFQGETSDHLARNIIEEDAEVAALQEVKVNRELGDFNQEILADLAEEQLPEGYQLDEKNVRYFNADGKRITDPDKQSDAARIVYNASNGEDNKTFEINKEPIDTKVEKIGADGELVPDRDANVTVYTSSLDGNPGYSIVYGSSNRHGTYGNSVVLAPGCEIPRDTNGRIAPGSVRQMKLGNDPPPDNERRTAVGVTFLTPDGKTAHAISGHMTNQKDDGTGRRAAIEEQYHALEKFGHSFGDNVIIGGDFNSTPGEDGMPTPPSMGFDTSGLDGIDHILVGMDESVSKARPKGEGGSDHDLFVAEVKI